MLPLILGGEHKGEHSGPKSEVFPLIMGEAKFGVLPLILGGSTGGSILGSQGGAGGSTPPHPVEVNIDPY